MTRCILIEPHKDAQIIFLEDTTYKTIKSIIKGIIGRTPVAGMPHFYILADDEFLYKEGLDFNRRLDNYLFYGTLLVVNEDPDDPEAEGYISLTDEQVEWTMQNLGKAPDPSETPTEQEKMDYLKGAVSFYSF